MMDSRAELLIEDAKKSLEKDAILKSYRFTLDEDEYKQLSVLNLFYNGFEITAHCESEVMGNKNINREYHITIRKK